MLLAGMTFMEKSLTATGTGISMVHAPISELTMNLQTSVTRQILHAVLAMVTKNREDDCLWHWHNSDCPWYQFGVRKEVLTRRIGGQIESLDMRSACAVTRQLNIYSIHVCINIHERDFTEDEPLRQKNRKVVG